MRRPAVVMAMVLGGLAALAIPSSALARSDCTYASQPPHEVRQEAGTAPGPTVTVYANDPTGAPDGGTTGGAAVAAGACADNVAPAAGFDGGLAEVGAGEDQATGAADPEVAPGVGPDAYAVIDGSDQNTDPTAQSDGYIGLSNWETDPGATGGSRDPACNGVDDGNAGSSNSGGCFFVKPGGPAVDLPDSVPTPICGNTSGNAWDGSGNEGTHQRDGCSIP